MFDATFNIVNTWWTTVMFGTLKDGSLQIDSLALNNCFSYRNVFQNSVKVFQAWFKVKKQNIKQNKKKQNKKKTKKEHFFFVNKCSNFRVI